MGSETDTMAIGLTQIPCSHLTAHQWPVPSKPHNGFRDLLNGHVDFEQWLGQVDSRRAVITVPCKQRQTWGRNGHMKTIVEL
jgi:hypothetical protein